MWPNDLVCVYTHIMHARMCLYIFSLVLNLISSRLIKHLSGPRLLKSVDYQSYDFLACLGKTAEERAGKQRASSMT